MRNAAIAFALALVVIENGFVSARQDQGADSTCRVTAPNGILAGSSERDGGSYGNPALSTFSLWHEGTIIFKPKGPGFLTSDGALAMKFGWMRGVSGTLRVAGRRLDGAAGPLRARIPDGYGQIGFQSTYVIFPTPGCWEVSAQIGERGDSLLTFITKVIKIGPGPDGRLDL